MVRPLCLAFLLPVSCQIALKCKAAPCHLLTCRPEAFRLSRWHKLCSCGVCDLCSAQLRLNSGNNEASPRIARGGTATNMQRQTSTLGQQNVSPALQYGPGHHKSRLWSPRRPRFTTPAMDEECMQRSVSLNATPGTVELSRLKAVICYRMLNE